MFDVLAIVATTIAGLVGMIIIYAGVYLYLKAFFAVLCFLQRKGIIR